jgi:hypothetical protein
MLGNVAHNFFPEILPLGIKKQGYFGKSVFRVLNEGIERKLNRLLHPGTPRPRFIRKEFFEDIEGFGVGVSALFPACYIFAFQKINTKGMRLMCRVKDDHVVFAFQGDMR